MLIDLLFTPMCIGCKSLGSHLCLGCRSSIQIASFDLRSPNLEVVSAGQYEGWLRDSVVRYKSGARSDVYGLSQVVDLMLPRASRIVPAPTSPEKVRDRGFDTIGQLSRQVVRRRRDVTVVPVLRLTRTVRDQVGLTADERRANLTGAIRSTRPVQGDFVVLDDVVTTGSTVQECARALKKAGADRVFVISLCASRNRGYL